MVGFCPVAFYPLFSRCDPLKLILFVIWRKCENYCTVYKLYHCMAGAKSIIFVIINVQYFLKWPKQKIYCEDHHSRVSLRIQMNG